jgi:hypothetical protein
MNPCGLEIKWFFYHFDQPCFYKEHFGFECPGCGMQRAFQKLLQGQFIESLQTFPGLIPLLLLFSYLFLHIVFKIKNGAKILIILFVINAVILTGNYLFKLTF